MSKEIYISSTPHETRLAIVEDDNLAEIYYERENEYTLAGSIYNGKVTRVLPGMQSSFVDVGLERDAFLYITDFMEETEEDTADFDASAAPAGERQPDRSPDRNPERNRRPEGGQARADRGARADRADRADRDDRGDRGDRVEQPRSSEPTDAELFTSAVSGLDPARPVVEGERVERGERDRGRRGGRNRNRSGNRQEGERGNATRTEEPRAAEPKVVEPSAAEPIAGNISIPDSVDEVGEGLPGADGSRRWRGRRGRRGNRGNGTARPEGALLIVGEDSAPRDTGPVYNAYDSAPNEVKEPAERELDLAAAEATLPTPAEQADFRERKDHGGRDRNGRGGRKDRGAGDRGVGSTSRAPLGLAPLPDLHNFDQGESKYGVEAEEAAPLEPVILPGESLSKYRRGEDGQVVKQVEVAPAAAPVDTFVAQGWDGGLVLPGETLRPRTNTANLRNDAPARTGERERGGRDRNERNERGGRDRGRRDGRQESPRRDVRPLEEPVAVAASVVELVPQLVGVYESVAHEQVEAQLPMVEQGAESAPVPTYLTEPEHVPASHLVTPLNTTFVPPPPMPDSAVAVESVAAESVAEATVVYAGEIPAEYEPEEASASYRIDPVQPREFRIPTPPAEQAAVVEESEEKPLALGMEFSPKTHGATELVTTVEVAHAVEVPAEFAQAEKVSAETHLARAHEFEQDFGVRNDAEPQEHVESPTETHDLTRITDTGEMQSTAAATSEYELPGQEIAEPSSPIEHEHAVVEQQAGRAEPVRPAEQYFEPGSGLLEEEMLEDEEDGDSLPTLHAQNTDLDPQEQEILEHAADLGTMIRDMSIDLMTRPESVLDENDVNDEDDEDFEEDLLEEDQDYSAEETEEEEDEQRELGEDIAYNDQDSLKELGEPAGTFADAGSVEHKVGAAAPADSARAPRREGRGGEPRREGRRESRRGDQGRRPGSGDRQGGGNERSGGGDQGRRDGHRGGRQSMQSTNLPAISDLLKPGQEILVQIAKEPIAKKGARITSHIALPGRFLVFMPTVSHTGVSRKIESDAERRRLKEILLSERGDAQGGFIVRTAAEGASEEELRSDLRFLLNLWADIKQRSEASKSPALIYHDLNLIERVLRDQVTDNFSAIWVDTEAEYERVLRFLQRFQPSLIRRVKLYSKETPLFEQFGITEEINKALRSKVWLKSGGSIVINQTEALVAIDINTGKFVGKTARLEDTIVKTNLDAIPEIVRQIRLRDLGGIIIIDFIDMDERKNRNKVMAALEEELKLDRAPSKVLQFNDFGLVAITRKRVKQSLERTLSTTCGVCAGTGMVKSPVTVCNDIYIEMRKMAKHLDRGDVMLRVHPDVVKQLKAVGTNWLQEMEEMVGKTILIKSDPALHPEQFDIH